MFLELARHPLLLDAVEQVLGPDFCLWGCQVFAKPAGDILSRRRLIASGDGCNDASVACTGDGMAVPMHQDGHYWPLRPLATCTVWVALDRCDHLLASSFSSLLSVSATGVASGVWRPAGI